METERCHFKYGFRSHMEQKRRSKRWKKDIKVTYSLDLMITVLFSYNIVFTLPLSIFDWLLFIQKSHTKFVQYKHSVHYWIKRIVMVKGEEKLKSGQETKIRALNTQKWNNANQQQRKKNLQIMRLVICDVHGKCRLSVFPQQQHSVVHLWQSNATVICMCVAVLRIPSLVAWYA